MTKFIRTVLTITFLAILTACGGGGGSAGNTTGAELFTTAANTLVIGPGQVQTYTIGGGVPKYAATSNSGAVLVSVNGQTLTITGAGSGSASITITDSSGKQVFISVTVGTNAKFGSSAPVNLTVGVGVKSGPYNMTGGSAIYAAAGSNGQVITVTQNGAQFFVTGVSAGKATVLLSDSLGATIEIFVTVGSETPFFTTAPSEVVVGVGANSGIFQIGGGGQIYTVSSNDMKIALTVLNGNQFYVSGIAAGKATITVSDNAGASKAISVKVGDFVDLFTTAPSSITVSPNVASSTYNIGGGTPAYSVATSNQQVANAVFSGNTFYVLGKTPGKATISVSDSLGAAKTLEVTVTAPPDLFTTAPSSITVSPNVASSTYTIGGGSPAYSVATSNQQVANVIFSGNTFSVLGKTPGKATISVSDSLGAARTLEVTVTGLPDLVVTAPSEVFVGIGTNSANYSIGGGDQNYSVTINNKQLASVSQTGNQFSVTGIAAGKAIVTISDGLGATKNVNVSITSVDLFSTAPSNLNVGINGKSSSFTIGGGTQNYTVSTSNQQIATVTQSGSSFVINGLALGTATISITDTAGANKKIDVTVGSAVNLFTNAPTDLVVGVSASSATYKIGGGDQNYTVITNNPQVATVTQNGNQFTVSGINAGKAILTVSDNSGGRTSINVLVGTGSDMYINAPSEVTVGVGLASATYIVGGGSKVYTAASSNQGIVTVLLTGNQFILTGVAVGKAKVTISDTLGGSKSIDVVVGSVLDLYTTAPSDLTVGVALNSATYQIGGGSPIYSVASSNAQVVTVVQAGGQFFLTGGLVGKATILITDSLGASKKINVTVGTGSDLFTNAGSDVTVGIGVDSARFQIGGGSLVYTVSSSNVQIANITLNGATFYITGVAAGKASVFVTDTLGASKKIDVVVGSGIDLFVTSPTDITIGIGIVSSIYQIGGGSQPYSVGSSNSQLVNVNLVGTTQFAITGVAGGKASVVITDSKGASKKVDVTVGSGVDLFTTAPSAVVLGVGNSSAVFKIGGGSQVYSVSSGSENVATVGQTGSTFLINGKAGGKAVISVKDSFGKEIKIDVIVGTADALFSTAPSDITIAVGAANIFKVGGGTTVYSASSSNTSVAAVSISGNDLTITALAIGKATVIIRDSTNGSLTVNLTVGSGVPTPLNTTSASDIVVPLSTSQTITIRDGKAPYVATSSNPSVLSTSLVGNTLTVQGLSIGAAKIVITDSAANVVAINATVGSGATVPLFMTAPVSFTMTAAAVVNYSIVGGTAPYTITSSNVSVLTVLATATGFTVTGVAPGAASIVVRDSLGASVSSAVTVTSTAVILDVLPGDSTGVVGDVMTFKIVGGSPSYTVFSNISNVATVTPTTVIAGGSFTASLLNVGTTSVTVTDAQGAIKTIKLTSTNTVPSLRFSPTSINIGEDSVDVFTLTVNGGTGPYRVFTSDLPLSSVSITGNIVTVGLGTLGSRCLIVRDAGGTILLGGSKIITLTVLDSLGVSATNNFSITDNGKGGAGCL